MLDEAMTGPSELWLFNHFSAEERERLLDGVRQYGFKGCIAGATRGYFSQDQCPSQCSGFHMTICLFPSITICCYIHYVATTL